MLQCLDVAIAFVYGSPGANPSPKRFEVTA